jgi:hypothetical protein
MNGRSQMQRDKNWILPKEISANRALISWKSGKPLMSLYGTEWRVRGYGVWTQYCAM